MKKILIMLMLFLFNSSIIFADNTSKLDYDVRNTRWGMSKKDVINSEKKLKPISKNDNIILYSDNIMNNKSYFSYLFENNILYGINYSFKKPKDRNKLLVELYKILDKKYKFKMNVYDGYGKIFMNDRSIVTLITNKDNDEVNVIYIDKEYHYKRVKQNEIVEELEKENIKRDAAQF